MVRVARAVSTERGRDPRRCTLVAFGGNGPVHAAEVARQLGIGRVLVPPWPGLFSAFGLLFAEPRHELVQAHRAHLASVTPADVLAGLGRLERAARARLADEGYAPDGVVLERLLDLRYRGQSSELRIPLDGTAALDAAVLAEAAARFEAEHERVYGHRDHPDRIELVNLRLVARARRDPLPTRLARASRSTRPASGTRLAFFGRQHGLVETRVVGRDELGGVPRPGPLIVEEYDATTVVPPGWSARLDALGNILLQP
jgi:N-methylhydantoinase A